MVMWDGGSETAAALADEYDLTFPILHDPNMELFNRWNPTGATPSSTMIDRGVEVYDFDIAWYQDLIESLVYE